MRYEKYINESDEWKILRGKAYNKAKHRCELCQDNAHAVHHVKYPKNYSQDSLDNLIVVCRRCHALVHGIRETIWDKTLHILKDGGWLLQKEVFDILHQKVEIDKWTVRDVETFFMEMELKLNGEKIIMYDFIKNNYIW